MAKFLYIKKREFNKALKLGTRKKIGDFGFDIFKKDLKPYKYEEYWECSQCYWQAKDAKIKSGAA